MHGFDLGYDNQMVAAKVWSTLFAVRDWAMKVEKNELTAPPAVPVPTWGDTLTHIAAVARDKAQMDSWKPCGLIPGVHVPLSGAPEEYEQGSPERVIVAFLAAWKARNYGGMSDHLTYLDKKYHAKGLARRIKEHYAGKQLKSYTLRAFTADAVNVASIQVTLVYEENGQEREHLHEFTVFYEDEHGKASIRGKAHHSWVFINAYV